MIELNLGALHELTKHKMSKIKILKQIELTNDSYSQLERWVDCKFSVQDKITYCLN